MPETHRVPAAPTPAQRRLLTAAAGLAVAVLAGGAFVLTYDLVHDLATTGRAPERWAPAYPIMLDALVVVTTLSLLVARDAPWWARWLRGLLLLAVASGTAAIAVQYALWGFDSLPERPLRIGVAVAPHVMLVLAIWLWYRMIKHFRPRRPTPPEADTEDSTSTNPTPLPPALLPTDVEVARDPSAPPQPPSAPRAETTQPDMIMPLTLDKDPEPAESNGAEHDSDGDLPIWDWDPPSGTYRSSPTPPEE